MDFHGYPGAPPDPATSLVDGKRFITNIKDLGIRPKGPETECGALQIELRVHSLPQLRGPPKRAGGFPRRS